MRNCSIYPPMNDISGWQELVVLQVVLAAVALAGHVMIFTVIARSEKLRDKQAYVFILSLSCADIVVGLLAQPLLATVIIGRHLKLCTMQKVSHFVASAASAGSGVGLVVISIDRLIYISRPMHYSRIMSKHRVAALLAYVWLLAIVLAAMPLMTESAVIYHTIIIGGMAFNSTVVIASYLTIFYIVRKSTANLPKLNESSNERSQSQATRTVAVVVVAFQFCWWPFTIVSFIWALRAVEYKPDSPMVSAYFWTLGLGHWNSALNVLIYGWKNTELRREMRKCVGLRRDQESSPDHSRQSKVMTSPAAEMGTFKQGTSKVEPESRPPDNERSPPKMEFASQSA